MAVLLFFSQLLKLPLSTFLLGVDFSENSLELLEEDSEREIVGNRRECLKGVVISLGFRSFEVGLLLNNVELIFVFDIARLPTQRDSAASPVFCFSS